MTRFKNTDFWLGIAILLGLGFLSFIIAIGLGALIGYVFSTHSISYIVFGSLLGSVAVFIVLLSMAYKKKESEDA